MSKNDFTLLNVKFDENFAAEYVLFVKQHKSRKNLDKLPSDLTLFVCNIPPFCTEEMLKALFEQFGSILHVYFASLESPTEIKSSKTSSIFEAYDEIKGYKVAYVVFTSVQALQKVLRNTTHTLILPNDKCTLLTGLKKWTNLYNCNIIDPLKMQQEIDEFMSNYNAECLKKDEIEKNAAEPDKEGWITVTKKGRNPGFSRKQSTRDKISRAIKRKKKKKTLLNFYAFQIKESKMNQLLKLREKFEEDKKKIENLKMQRKFKPF